MGREVLAMIIKIDKSNEPFDMTKSHEFEPSGELAKEAQKEAQQIKVGGAKVDKEATEKMRKCKHNRLWRFSVGIPSNIIGCCDCAYWRFYNV